VIDKMEWKMQLVDMMKQAENSVEGKINTVFELERSVAK